MSHGLTRFILKNERKENTGVYIDGCYTTIFKGTNYSEIICLSMLVTGQPAKLSHYARAMEKWYDANWG